MKKIINRIPGGESNLKSLIAALFLVKEYYRNNDKALALMETKYLNVLSKLNSVTLVEEEIAVKKFISVLEDAPVNAVGGGQAVSTDQPKISAKNIKKFKYINRRKPINATQIKT